VWPKRKLKNRRFERDHILEVKLRSSQRRQLRFRQASFLLGGAFSIFFGLFAVWRGGEWLIRRFLTENPAFAIHQLDVQTDGIVSIEQLRRWAGVRLENNLLGLDLARVKRDLELMPAVESVDVERVLPHTLRIRVTEREPIAQFEFPQIRLGGVYGGGVYLLDAKGCVMSPLEPQQRSVPVVQTNEHLPILAGVPLTDLRPGRPAESPQVHAALRLIEALDRSPMAGLVDFMKIDLSAPGILQVTTGQNSEVTFGLNDLEGQLRRWRLVYDHGQITGKHLASIDLSVSNNLPARWLEASLVPMAAQKIVKPSRYKKKNV
jgi:cell division septal protein FtsQ